MIDILNPYLTTEQSTSGTFSCRTWKNWVKSFLSKITSAFINIGFSKLHQAIVYERDEEKNQKHSKNIDISINVTGLFNRFGSFAMN